MEFKEHRIDFIEPGSLAQKAGICPGDFLVSVNGRPVSDVFDYHFLISDELVTLRVRRALGGEEDFFFEKPYYEDPGIGFDNGLMDDYRSCYNHCIFCFIDQMPPGMRDTLYFKDDDSRLSFLQGNYVTLTNMKEEDVERIITYKLAPINVSVHTTNPELRVKMLHNRFAGESLLKLQRFYEAGIEMNGQIVLCRGINDGEELERSIRDLSNFLPCMESLSVVPVGLTKFRDGLYPLEPFTKEDACAVIDCIERWQKICYEKHRLHFVHASDEWYLLAEREFPPEETYDGYIQLENGVGMIPLLEAEFTDCLKEEALRLHAPQKRHGGLFLGASNTAFWHRKKEEKGRYRERPAAGIFRESRESRLPEPTDAGTRNGKVHLRSIATGRLAAPLLHKLAAGYMELHPETEIRVYTIRNDFFGERITVSGLLTGQDLKKQLSGQELGEMLLLPCNLLRSGEEVFLDDMTLAELENALQVPIHIVKSDGQSLFDAMNGA